MPKRECSRPRQCRGWGGEGEAQRDNRCQCTGRTLSATFAPYQVLHPPSNAKRHTWHRGPPGRVPTRPVRQGS
eukprot:3027899-Alexandrium_andersonii.AAC.1